jgi:hypothetical protein
MTGYHRVPPMEAFGRFLRIAFSFAMTYQKREEYELSPWSYFV